MAAVSTEEPLAVAVVEAIGSGDLPALQRLLADAKGFGRWRAAHRLIQRGARTTIDDAATLGLLDRLERHVTGATPPAPEEVNRWFSGARHGGQQCADYLLDRGADLNWIAAWENLTPLDAPRRNGAVELVGWLCGRGARSTAELNAS